MEIRRYFRHGRTLLAETLDGSVVALAHIVGPQRKAPVVSLERVRQQKEKEKKRKRK